MQNETMSINIRPHVIIVGGGFGGTHAAHALRHAPARWNESSDGPRAATPSGSPTTPMPSAHLAPEPVEPCRPRSSGQGPAHAVRRAAVAGSDRLPSGQEARAAARAAPAQAIDVFGCIRSV